MDSYWGRFIPSIQRDVAKLYALARQAVDSGHIAEALQYQEHAAYWARRSREMSKLE